MAGMWFYAKDGEQHGPVEAGDIRSRLSSGDLSNSTLVWREGMAQWSPLGEVLELRDPVPTGIGAQPSAAPAASVAPQGIGAAPSNTSYAQPAPQLVAPVPQNTMALTSMILALVSVVACMGPLTGIPAIICGHIARRQFRESPVPQSGEGMATAGLIIGYLVSILSILGVVAYFVLIFTAIGVSSGVPTSIPAPAP